MEIAERNHTSRPGLRTLVVRLRARTGIVRSRRGRKLTMSSSLAPRDRLKSLREKGLLTLEEYLTELEQLPGARRERRCVCY